MDTTSSMHTQRRPSGSSKPAPANLPLFRFASSSTLSGNSNKKKQHRSSSSSSISSVDSSSSSSSSSYSDSFTTSPSPSPSLESSPSLGSSGGSDIGSEDEDAIKNEIRQYCLGHGMPGHQCHCESCHPMSVADFIFETEDEYHEYMEILQAAKAIGVGHYRVPGGRIDCGGSK